MSAIRPINAAFAAIRTRFAHPRVRAAMRVLGWTVATLYFAFALLVLVLRYAILPQIENYRPDIERALSAALHQSVAIRHIEAGWQGLRPSLTLSGFELRDAANRPALVLEHVEADLGWTSLLFLAPRLHRLEVVAPEVVIRRDPSGKLFVAGLEIDTASADDSFSDWLLAQRRIVVRDATITWHDELRRAPPLALSRLNFDLRNSGNRHRFGLTAEPPHELAARIDLRGDFKGKDIDLLRAWTGEAYVELDYADLAGWRSWIDYPVELPQGSGGVRLWLGFAAKRLTSVAADVRLADVQLRLGKDLPLLELERVDGHLTAKRLADGFEAEAKRLTLQARSGARIDPTDFRLRWEAPTVNRAARGEFSAAGLDLAALTQLATHLPFDETVRQKLATWSPRGRLLDLAASWSGEAGALQSWKVKGRFEGLGLAAHGDLPGFSGFSGTVAADEKGGILDLDSHQAAIEMPAVFSEPRLELQALTARTSWQAADGRIMVDLKKAEFQNRDAAGEFKGSYRTALDGPGEIDLSGKLTRAAGDAVWRYMPLVVNKDVRDWLQTSLIGGQASEATLRLKGDLRKFPFPGSKDGIFEVKGRFRGATLRFAEGWPEIRNVDGELLFEGVRMLIKGSKGSLLGANVAAVSAEIPDLETYEEQLNIAGKVSGATAEFLKFIEASPVGSRIDHFTAPMAAAGNGDLDLKLAMPLRHLDKTQVDGRFRFANNRLTVDADLPPLTDVNGELRFTADRLEAQKVRATMFGAPMTLDVTTAGEGLVTVKAAGTASVRELRQQFPNPVFDHLSGSAPWSGTVRVQNQAAEVRIESSLRGIASSLPQPFNKSATTARSLVIERKPAAEPARPGAPARDQLLLSYGDSVKAQLLRRHEGPNALIERGAVAIGIPLRLPEKGLLLAAELETLDVDFWQRLFKNGNGGGSGGGMPVNQVAVHAEELLAHGRSFSNVRVNAARDGAVWRADVSGDSFAGRIDWSGEAGGRLSGRMARVVIPESVTSLGHADPEELNELPAINLTIDRFSLRGKEFGEVKLQAENRDGAWNAKLDVKNEDGSLVGQGRWRPHVSAPLTQLDFNLEAKSVEKMLARLGYPQAVRRGTATLDGSLTWAGSPLAIHYPSLSGKLRLDAASGQFSKLEPGVGRLLGVLSLQSLPRRIVLDFRDVFSEGFAFDSIAGESTVTRGILETRDLQIVGPSARVLLNGSINLPSETQNLRVRVQPAIGETVALGAVLANPAIGAVTWLAQKLFKDPFGRVFAFEYTVTGGWADPKVEKVGGGATAQDPKEAK
ncbi:MAG: TIGR02099 family protein [Gammaproteobacteria bacterium]|nr:TIGR02099 family protein [Gammaproteobacteria bacterium]MBU1645990.1 TIGR02099 family protein [Gammaproteobacteria bacterium]MBU1972052.1 TIGR02099 family protein [Gammaproteobacteria bacterium]